MRMVYLVDASVLSYPLLNMVLRSEPPCIDMAPCYQSACTKCGIQYIDTAYLRYGFSFDVRLAQLLEVRRLRWFLPWVLLSLLNLSKGGLVRGILEFIGLCLSSF